MYWPESPDTWLGKCCSARIQFPLWHHKEVVPTYLSCFQAFFLLNLVKDGSFRITHTHAVLILPAVVSVSEPSFIHMHNAAHWCFPDSFFPPAGPESHLRLKRFQLLFPLQHALPTSSLPNPHAPLTHYPSLTSTLIVYQSSTTLSRK